MLGVKNMKIKQYIKFICALLIFPLFLTNNVYAGNKYNIPQTITITTGKTKLGEVEYENYTISARRIYADDKDDVVYCLDIDKGYPSGQVFYLKGNTEAIIDNILASGYPDKTLQELNLSNEDDAYFATQIAIWCALEGYDVNKLTGDNKNVIEAIRTIYNQGIEGENIKETLNKEYISSNQSIQRVVISFDIKPAQEG